jgi:uncharacterized delta-60 repeat protein
VVQMYHRTYPSLAMFESLERRRLLAGIALDLNFGASGRVSSELRTDGGVSEDWVYNAVVLNSGKILVATNRGLLRYNVDGTRDTTFGPDGVGANGVDDAFRMQLLPDGKIIAAYGGGIARLNADGSLDESFGENGYAHADSSIGAAFLGSDVLSDGKILVTGRLPDLGSGPSDGAIWRFNTDGSPDTTFGSNGMLRNTSTEFILFPIGTPDGSFYAATNASEAKFTASGVLDTSFGNDGFLSVTGAFRLRQPDGKLLALGTVQPNPSDLVVSRWNPNGTPDLGFGSNGSKTIDFGESDTMAGILLDSAGRIIVGGTTRSSNPNTYEDFAYSRLNPDGSFDSTFGFGGIYVDPFIQDGVPQPTPVADTLWMILLAPDNKLVAVGRTRLYSTEDPTLTQTSDNIALTRYALDAPINISAGPFGPVSEAQLFNVIDTTSTYANGQIIRYEWDYALNPKLFQPEAQGQSAQLRAGDDPGATIGIRVTTSDGLQAVGFSSVSVANLPPTADAGPDRVAAAGVPVKLVLSSIDFVPEQGKFTVDFGDGTPSVTTQFVSSANPRRVTYTHTYAAKGNYTITLTADDGDGGSSTDTASVRVGDIVATTFQDTDGIGSQNSGEPGFPGQVVWVDLNGNGVQDSTEPAGVSDSFGDVMFDGLSPGTHTLRTQVPAGWQLTFPNSAYRGDSCDATITATTGAACAFGLTQLAMITGTVFNDLNGNGVRDAGEPALASQQTFATDLAGNLINGSLAFSASDGFYRIRSLNPGNYYVKIGLQSGWIQTFPAGKAPHPVSVSTAQTVQNMDFGIRQAAGATAKGLVFEDVDGDGVYGPNDQPYLFSAHLATPKMYIDLDNDGTRDANELLFSGNTDGTWQVSGLPAGTYTFRLLPRPGWIQTWPANDGGITVQLNAGQTVSGLNFGFHKVDTQPPQVADFHFRYDLKPNSIEFVFSEPVEISSGSLVVRTASGQYVTFDLASNDQFTGKAIFVPRSSPVLADDNYEAILLYQSYRDLAGNRSGEQQEWPFFVLKGDLNRDRTVSISDFITLASNFNKTSATYSDGDLNYDGAVTISDFIDLAANFNKTLEAPAAAIAPQAPAAQSVSLPSATTDLLQQNNSETKKRRSAAPDWRKPHRLHHRRRPILGRQ